MQLKLWTGCGRPWTIYPVNPNLLFSTTDTVFFTFEGRKNSNGQWEWKLVPRDSSSNVRSNFEVSNDAENKGGLHVRLTVTLTASGLAAPPYIAVTDLTDAELSPDLCLNLDYQSFRLVQGWRRHP